MQIKEIKYFELKFCTKLVFVSQSYFSASIYSYISYSVLFISCFNFTLFLLIRFYSLYFLSFYSFLLFLSFHFSYSLPSISRYSYFPYLLPLLILSLFYYWRCSSLFLVFSVFLFWMSSFLHHNSSFHLYSVIHPFFPFSLFFFFPYLICILLLDHCILNALL